MPWAPATGRAPAVPPAALGRLVDRTVGRWLAPMFGLLSRLRGARSLHPDGRRVIIGARAVWAGPEQPLTRLDEVGRAVGAGLRGFDLLLALSIGAWTSLPRIPLYPNSSG